MQSLQSEKIHTLNQGTKGRKKHRETFLLQQQLQLLCEDTWSDLASHSQSFHTHSLIISQCWELINKCGKKEGNLATISQGTVDSGFTTAPLGQDWEHEMAFIIQTAATFASLKNMHRWGAEGVELKLNISSWVPRLFSPIIDTGHQHHWPENTWKAQVLKFARSQRAMLQH